MKHVRLFLAAFALAAAVSASACGSSEITAPDPEATQPTYGQGFGSDN